MLRGEAGVGSRPARRRPGLADGMTVLTRVGDRVGGAAPLLRAPPGTAAGAPVPGPSGSAGARAPGRARFQGGGRRRVVPGLPRGAEPPVGGGGARPPRLPRPRRDWLDDASAESLIFAGRRLEAEGVALVFAAREGEARSFEAPGLDELRLKGLDPDSAEALLDSHAPVPLSPEARERLIEGTNGNPLALLELSATLSDAQLSGAEPLFFDVPGWRAHRAGLPVAGASPADETQTLLLVAAADESGSPATVLGVAGPARSRGAGIRRRRGGRAPAHARLRAHVSSPVDPLGGLPVGAVLPAPRRAPRTGRRARRRLRRRPSRVASGGGHVEPDASVAEELQQAARRAQQRSGFVAASLAYERAAALTTDEHERARLLSGAAERAWFAGRTERALMLLERARPYVVDPGRARRGGSLARPDRDQHRRAERRARSSRARRDGHGGGRPGARALHARPGVHRLGLRRRGGRRAEIARLAAELPDATPSPVTPFLGDIVRGTGDYFAGDSRGRRAEPEGRGRGRGRGRRRGVGAAPEPPDPRRRGGPFLGDDRAAERLNRRLATRARETGALSLLNDVLPRPRGQPDRDRPVGGGRGGLTKGLQLARQTGQHQVVAHMLAVLAHVAGLRGDDDECRALADESRALASERKLVHVTLTARWALLALELGHGRADEASVLGARDHGSADLAVGRSRSRRGRDPLGRRPGRPDLARRFEDWARSTVRPGASGSSIAAARPSATTPTRLPGSSPRPSSVSPAEGGRSSGRAPSSSTASSCADPPPGRGAEHLRIALEGFESLGARGWAERAGAELRASGQTAVAASRARGAS